MERLVAFIRRLEAADLHYYSLRSSREAVTVHVMATSNERRKVEFLPDGTIEVERFVREGGVAIADGTLLSTLSVE